MPYLLVTIAVVGVLYFILGTFAPHKLRAQRFESRPSIAFDDIYARDLQARGVELDAARRVWTEAAAKLRVDGTKLRASDRFDKELSHMVPAFPYVDLNDEFYWWTVDAMKRSGIKNEVFEGAKTLGDYVVAFAAAHTKPSPPR